MRELLGAFPIKPKNKNGWPWDLTPDQSINLPKMVDGKPWPKISIVTPSFNQGRFLEETIRSVLLQDYPNLEYIIMDGGSADQSVDIIRQYQDHISYWESTPDRGQAHAINKGFQSCSGDLVAWINSDDLLLPGALHKLALAYKTNPEAILLGSVIHFYDGQNWTRVMHQKKVTFKNMVSMAPEMLWQQPGTFVPGKIIRMNGPLDESLRYVFDRDWMCKLLKKYDVTYLPEPVAMFRLHENSKTIKEKFLWLPEEEMVTKRYWDDVQGLNKNLILARFELTRAAIALGAKNWNRSQGIDHLHQAVAIYRPILFSFLFIELMGRCLFPYQFLMKVRSYLAKIDPYYKN